MFSFNNKPFIAIIGDIKASKEIENRNEIQKKMNKVLEEINKEYKNDISSKFLMTLGDEFQGLLNNGTNIMNIIFEIERQMYPINLRFGIGIGKITTNINKEMAIGADGPGYYKAREAIEFLKSNEKKKKAVISDIWFKVEDNDQIVIVMLNTILTLMKAIKDSWTNRQREIIWDMLENQDSQVKVAERLKIQQPTVQKSFSKGKYYTYKNALDIIKKVLKEMKNKK